MLLEPTDQQQATQAVAVRVHASESVLAYLKFGSGEIDDCLASAVAGS